MLLSITDNFLGSELFDLQFLDGAGVDIIDQTFWADSLPRQDRAWVIIPSGRTSWVIYILLFCFTGLIGGRQGLDWHGPSAADAFTAVAALHDILHEGFVDWVYPRDTKVVVVGHSNGGQGAWYMSSRWPDRVKAGMSNKLSLICQSR